jgi:D-alanyl-D-alanine carboxypeptidase (penicillin-binding protein 5/6)
VLLGAVDSVQPAYSGADAVLVPKQGSADIEYSVDLPDKLTAPVSKGSRLGTLTVKNASGTIAEVPIIAGNAAERLSVPQIFLRLAANLAGG